jgi:adenylate cyclase
MSQSRRLAAILAADVVGYSRLMGADEEGTLHRLKALRGELVDLKIAQHHGRIIKTTGDGLLVEFASVVDAVRCAAEVQQAMPEQNAGLALDRRIELRIGINLGDVITDGDDLFGDGVNIAARIEALADAGSVFVSRSVYEQVRDRLPFVFEDRGEQQVKNIARPVRVYRLLLNEAATAVPERAPLPPPDKPSIAVLAFTNMSGDPEQEYFSDGVADDIITELSRSHSLFVIARNSSFTYKGRAVDIKQVGRELGVRYVLEGSVRRGGDRVRVVAQLIDAETGNHIWAERYDRALEDVFAVQDEITTAVVTAIIPAVADAELRRLLRKPPESLGAWEAYSRGQWHLGQTTAADHERAEHFFHQAITMDANFSAPYVGLARACLDDAVTFGTRSLNDVAETSARWARKASAIDPEDAEARAMVAWTTLYAGNADEAYDQVSLARASNPNSPLAMLIEAQILNYTGQPAQARQGFAAYLRADPRGPHSAQAVHQIAISYYHERDYARSVETTRRVIARYPDAPNNYRWLAAALGQLGQTEEALKALHKALALSPRLFDFYIRHRPPWYRPEDHTHMLDGLRKAGWDGSAVPDDPSRQNRGG